MARKGSFRRLALACGMMAVLGCGSPANVRQSPLSANTVHMTLSDLENRLQHSMDVRSTLLCETPDAHVGIVQIQQIHVNAQALDSLDIVIHSNDRELSEHALVVLQEQQVLLSMGQENIYGIIEYLYRYTGVHTIYVEGVWQKLTSGDAALAYANALGRLRDIGLFQPNPTGSDMFPLEPERARIVAGAHVFRYWAKQLIATAGPGVKDPLVTQVEGFPPDMFISEDFDYVKYAPGAALLAAADFGLRVLPVEDVEYTRRVMRAQQSLHEEAKRTGREPTLREMWEDATDGREDVFLAQLRAHARSGEVAVMTLGAAHTFSGPASCPSSPPGAFDDRFSWRDNLALWKSLEGYAVSVLEVEPTMNRDVQEQVLYNDAIAIALRDELYARRARK